MWFRKKNKKEEQNQVIQPIIIENPKCSHKWVDFDLYFLESYKPLQSTSGEYRSFKWEIIEPYVCCWCKKRDNVILAQQTGEIYTNQYNDALKAFITPYQERLKPKGLVEDQIQDMLHCIDREYLTIVASMYPEKLGLNPEDVKKFIEKTERINLNERRILTLPSEQGK